MLIREYKPNRKIFREELKFWQNHIKPNGKPYTLIIAKRGITNSFFIPELQTKIVNLKSTWMEGREKISSPLFGSDHWLAGEYARDWLKYLYPVFKASGQYKKYKRSAPMFFSGKFLNRDLVYFDIVSAYWQMYKRLWLDFTEIGMVNRYPLLDIADQLKYWKESRNAVIGNLATDEACLITGKKWSHKPMRGKKSYNPMLLYFINTALMEISNDALKLGCCYIATDCFIFPKEARWRDFSDLLDKYGLEFRCTIGNGSILKWAGYSIEGEAIRGNKNVVGTELYKTLFTNFIDNPIFADDVRIKLLLKKWNKPLRKVDLITGNDIINYWSKLNNGS